MTALPSHVQELADRVATGHGVEVLELTLRGQGRGRVLSVILDAEEPVEADVVELVSKDLSRALDEADPVAGSYTLEVSTPGLSRPLHTSPGLPPPARPRGHHRPRRGPPPRRGRPSVQGVVVDADDEAVVLEVDGEQVRVPLSEVVRGKVVLPW